MAKSSSETPHFETALAELNTLVEEMERGGLQLEEALKKFERGIELTRTCQKALSDAEQKVQILTQKDTGAELQAFDLPAEES